MYNILTMLEEKPLNYANLYKITKVSHDTLQKSIRFLLEKNLIKKDDKGHKRSSYIVTDDGKRYSRLLDELEKF